MGEKKELNNLELDFLTAIDWRIYVSPDEYEETTRKLEMAVAAKQVEDRGGWTTYSDLMVLSRTLELIKVWDMIYEYTLKVTAVCAFAYAASLMTMIGTCQLLSNRNSVQVIDSRTPSTRTDWSKMNQGGITDFGDDETEELPETPFNEDRLADLDF